MPVGIPPGLFGSQHLNDFCGSNRFEPKRNIRVSIVEGYIAAVTEVQYPLGLLRAGDRHRYVSQFDRIEDGGGEVSGRVYE